MKRTKKAKTTEKMDRPTIISVHCNNLAFWVASCWIAAESSYGCCDYGKSIQWQFPQQLRKAGVRAPPHRCKALSTATIGNRKLSPRQEWQLDVQGRMTKLPKYGGISRDDGRRVDAGKRGCDLAEATSRARREVRCASSLGMEDNWMFGNGTKAGWQVSKLTQSRPFMDGGGGSEETVADEGIHLSSSDDGPIKVAEDAYAVYHNRKHVTERRSSRNAEERQPDVLLHTSQSLEVNSSNSNVYFNLSLDSQSPAFEEQAAPCSTTKDVNAETPDDKLNQLLEEAEALLNEGREAFSGRIEITIAEKMLYKAADLFAAAANTDPSSLIALGSWGNTLLLHGQLKFRLSEELFSMIQVQEMGGRRQWQAAEEEEWREQMEVKVLQRSLQLASEESEKLLVEAGRKYRLALSLDRRDARALYNWGLALCLRAQLIVKEGRAFDADKIYLAAIDKFKALMSIDQSHALGALLNWGLAMRDRSRLRPIGNKERVMLLLQAKDLFQYALKLDPRNGQAKGAAAACNVELREVEEYTNYQNKFKRPSRSRKPWWNFW